MLKNDATIFKAEIYDTTKNLVNLDNQIRARISYFWFECMGIWKCPHCFVGAYFTKLCMLKYWINCENSFNVCEIYLHFLSDNVNKGK